MNKSEFIRERLNKGMSNKQIVAEAKEAGVSFAPAYISVIKNNLKAKSKSKAKAATKPAKSSAPLVNVVDMSSVMSVSFSASQFIRETNEVRARIDAIVNEHAMRHGLTVEELSKVL